MANLLRHWPLRPIVVKQLPRRASEFDSNNKWLNVGANANISLGTNRCNIFDPDWKWILCCRCSSIHCRCWRIGRSRRRPAVGTRPLRDIHWFPRHVPDRAGNYIGRSRWCWRTCLLRTTPEWPRTRQYLVDQKHRKIGHKEKSQVFDKAIASLPTHCPLWMLRKNPLSQSNLTGHCSHGCPHALPTVAQHSCLVHTTPCSWPWHMSLLILVKHGPVR